MSLEKTWYHAPNQTDAGHASVLALSRWQLWWHAALITGNIAMTDLLGASIAVAAGAKWTTYYSCNSVTAGVAGDGVDRLHLTSFTAGDWVRAANGVAHSWGVYVSPSMGGSVWYMTIDFVGASDFTYTLTFSKTAPTGGTTLTRPTSTDEWVYTALTLNTNAAVAWNMQGLLATDGTFVIRGSRTTSGIETYGIICIVPANVKALDTYPLWTFANYDSANGALWSGNTATATAEGLGGLMHSIDTNATGPKQRSYDGTAVIALGVFGPQSYGTTGAASPIFALQGWLSGGDIIDGTWPQFPLWIGSSQSGALTPLHRTIKGRIPDMFFVPDILADGDVQVATTTIAVGSNGQSLPQATINVVDASLFATAGTALVTTASGVQTVAYTGKSSTTLTGCTGGVGAMSTGGAVTGMVIAVVSGNLLLPGNIAPIL